jgi:hypothetical protein
MSVDDGVAGPVIERIQAGDHPRRSPHHPASSEVRRCTNGR